MYKYLFGSNLLKLNNCRDEDWLTFVDLPSHSLTERGQRSIPFYKEVLQTFIEGKSYPEDFYKACYQYQLSNGFFENDESYPFSYFNVFDHKELWINQLKGFMNHEEAEAHIDGEDILPKSFYHILYQYYMIKENAHYISDEAKIDVQKIHDYEMPSSYFYELRDKVNNL